MHTVVVKVKAVAKTKAAETEAIADDAQKDLDQALPDLEAANTVSDFMLDQSSRSVIYPSIKESLKLSTDRNFSRYQGQNNGSESLHV